MLARVFSCAVIGLDGVVIEVEVDTADGLPGITIVGLPDAAVQESRERVQSAIKNSGHRFPRKRITVNLAPASVRKAGPAYDLPIAVGVLLSAELIEVETPSVEKEIAEAAWFSVPADVDPLMPLIVKLAGGEAWSSSSVEGAKAVPHGVCTSPKSPK